MKCSAIEGKCYEMFSKRGKMLWNIQQKRENVQQKRENAMKFSAKEVSYFTLVLIDKHDINCTFLQISTREFFPAIVGFWMFSKRGEMLWI